MKKKAASAIPGIVNFGVTHDGPLDAMNSEQCDYTTATEVLATR